MTRDSANPPEEAPIAPKLAIVDAHHHFWGAEHPGAAIFGAFLPNQFIAAIAASGHWIRSSVYVDCGWSFREHGPEDFRCVGETEQVESVASNLAANGAAHGNIAAGIVARADLMLGDAVAPILEAHIAASPTRFRGIRALLAHDPEVYQALKIPPGMSRDPQFRAGFKRLARLGLSLDVLCVHTMLGDIVELARAFPDTAIIINHLAGPIGVGRFRDRRAEVFANWRAGIGLLAQCPNVSIKLSGFGAELMGFGWTGPGTKPSSETIAIAIRPYVQTAIEAFSPSRCMVASNFPVDGLSCSYGTLWNALKRATSGCSPDELDQIFHDTATRIYHLYC